MCWWFIVFRCFRWRRRQFIRSFDTKTIVLVSDVVQNGSISTFTHITSKYLANAIINVIYWIYFEIIFRFRFIFITRVHLNWIERQRQRHRRQFLFSFFSLFDNFKSDKHCVFAFLFAPFFLWRTFRAEEVIRDRRKSNKIIVLLLLRLDLFSFLLSFYFRWRAIFTHEKKITQNACI